VSRRSGQPDTPADVLLRECVTGVPLRSFAMVGGHPLGFADLYAALSDSAPNAFQNGLLDARAWPVCDVHGACASTRRRDSPWPRIRSHGPPAQKQSAANQESLRGLIFAESLRELRAANCRLTVSSRFKSFAAASAIFFVGWKRLMGQRTGPLQPIAPVVFVKARSRDTER
jgi:hypothetical protein